jgi:N6-adenosine-specific RNA methylase IME4
VQRPNSGLPLGATELPASQNNARPRRAAAANGYWLALGLPHAGLRRAKARCDFYRGIYLQAANDNDPFTGSKKYAIVYADPPWDYKGQTQHAGKASFDTGGAQSHYSTVTTAEMKQWHVAQVCQDDCLLFMWASSPHLDQAIELGKAWGFRWATLAFVWDKQRTNPGFYTLSMCELCLVFKRGRIPTPRGARNVRQLVSELRGRHSEKPHEVRRRIELMFPTQNKIELFARQYFPGWDAWGKEVDSEVFIAANDNLPEPQKKAA